MSSFPHGGNLAATRKWLDSEGYNDKFVGWKADALVGADKEIISKKFQLPEEEDKYHILLSLLAVARELRG